MKRILKFLFFLAITFVFAGCVTIASITGDSLFVAARKGDVERVKFLLELGADVNATDTDTYSVMVGNVYYMLTPRDVSPDRIDGTIKKYGCDMIGGETVLMEAALYHRPQVVQLLLEKGADPNLVPVGGKTALMNAAAQRNKEIIRLLLVHGAKLDTKDRCGRTVFDRSDRMVVTEVMHDLDRKKLTAVPSSASATGLNRDLVAFAEVGDNVKIEKLLARGADLRTFDDRGNGPLLMAAANGHSSTVKLLLKRGSDANAKNLNGYTALHAAAGQGHVDVARILVAGGADVNQTNYSGETAMFPAASTGHIEMIRLLLEYRVDVNGRATTGQTPLMRAVFNGQSDMVEFLLKAGADAKAKDDHDSTALRSVGRRCISPKAAKTLIDHTTDSQKDVDNAFLSAITGPHDSSSCYDFVKFLLDNGANINYTNYDGPSALRLARLWNHQKIEQLLLSRGAKI